MTRAVAGRRALQVVLLLAGLLALGFICGERAQAADGVAVPEHVESVRSVEAVPSAEPVRERVAEAARDGRDAVRRAAVEPVLEPAVDAAEPVVRAAARGVVRPVVGGVTGVVGGAPQRVLPEAPGVPGLPELPQPGADDSPGADGGVEPRSPQAGQGAAASGTAHEARAESSYGTGAHVRTLPLAYAGTGDGHLAGQQVRDADLGDANRTGQEPFPSVPGDPARTLGGQSAGDGGSTRHGDPCAASPDSRAPVRLLRGAEAAQVPAPVRERHRDIPEFPG